MQPINSSQNKRFKEAMQLHRSRGRKKQDRIIVFGARAIERALISGIEPDEIFVGEPSQHHPDAQRILQSLIHKGFPTAHCFVLAPALFDSLAYGDRPDSIVMTAAKPKSDLEAIGGLPMFSEPPSAHSLIVVCEQIEKPGNLGGILRSADGSGTDAVLIADALTDPFHPNSIRNSAGAAFSIPTARASSAEIISWLKRREYRILTATPEAPVSLFNQNIGGRIAIVLGNEAQGVSEQFRQSADETFFLPMLGVADSLNVSVTGAICMYEALRQRQLQLQKQS